MILETIEQQTFSHEFIAVIPIQTLRQNCKAKVSIPKQNTNKKEDPKIKSSLFGL